MIHPCLVALGKRSSPVPAQMELPCLHLARAENPPLALLFAEMMYSAILIILSAAELRDMNPAGLFRNRIMSVMVVLVLSLQGLLLAVGLETFLPADLLLHPAVRVENLPRSPQILLLAEPLMVFLDPTIPAVDFKTFGPVRARNLVDSGRTHPVPAASVARAARVDTPTRLELQMALQPLLLLSAWNSSRLKLTGLRACLFLSAPTKQHILSTLTSRCLDALQDPASKLESC